MPRGGVRFPMISDFLARDDNAWTSEAGCGLSWTRFHPIHLESQGGIGRERPRKYSRITVLITDTRATENRFGPPSKNIFLSQTAKEGSGAAAAAAAAAAAQQQQQQNSFLI